MLNNKNHSEKSIWKILSQNLKRKSNYSEVLNLC